MPMAKPGQEAEGFNAHGDVVDAEHARDGKLADDGEAEHLDSPHAEDFHRLRETDFQDALLHAHGPAGDGRRRGTEAAHSVPPFP